jgi:hypothetical protein
VAPTLTGAQLLWALLRRVGKPPRRSTPAERRSRHRVAYDNRQTQFQSTLLRGRVLDCSERDFRVQPAPELPTVRVGTRVVGELVFADAGAIIACAGVVVRVSPVGVAVRVDPPRLPLWAVAFPLTVPVDPDAPPPPINQAS